MEMVTSLRGRACAIVAGAAVLLALAACDPLQFFSGSIYPPDLPAREMRVDLSADIPAGAGSIFQASIAEQGTTRLVVLLSSDLSMKTKVLFVFDRDLTPLGSFTTADLDAFDAGQPFGGGGVLVDTAGNLAVGNRLFTMASGTPRYAQTIAPGLGSPCVSVGTAGFLGGFGFNYVDPDTKLQYQHYGATWALARSPSVQFQTGSGWGWVPRAFTDPSGSGTVYLLATGDAGPWLVPIPNTEAASDTVIQPVLTMHPSISSLSNGVNLSSLDMRTVGFTSAGFAACQQSGNESKLLLFDLDGTVTASRALSYVGGQQHLYGYTDGWYVYDQESRTLTRNAWWWK
jgi:hypothetical protein